MSQPLRRRSPSKLNSEEYILQLKSSNKSSVTSKKNSRVDSSEHLLKKRTRASKKIPEQNENTVPQIKKATATEKISFSNHVHGLSLQPLKYDIRNKTTALLAKSPVLRDRTNAGSDFTKVDLSLNKDVPLTKQKASTKKLGTIVVPSEKLTSRADSERKYFDILQEIKIPKESQANTLPLPKQIILPQNDSNQEKSGLKAEKTSRTRSGKVTMERNCRAQDDSIQKKKKFFKSGNSNKLTIYTGKELVKEAGRKRKFVKKTTIDDNSASFLVFTTDKVSPSKKKTLRPRQSLKNYCEESKLLEQLSPEKRNSIVVIEKLSDPNAKQLPIWKSVKFPDSECKRKDIYDIVNDVSSEEHRPKKKKRITKKHVKRLKKAVEPVKAVKKRKPAKLIKAPDTFEQVPKKEEIVEKPKMVSIEILDKTKKINILPTPPMAELSNEFKPFRVTQVFHPRSTMQNNMSDHSLLSKSMSPILKVTENINSATPWRIPPVESFSRIRNLVQSTPQQNKITLTRSNLGFLGRKSTMHDKSKMNRIKENESKNVQEIPNNGKNDTSSAEATIQYSFPFDDDAEDKENTVPNLQSPQKLLNKNDWSGAPVFEPQPGPSGLQKQPLREAKILRQTNLNNFLSLDDTPERMEIRTTHRIFDDVHSTPINGNLLKKIYEPNIQNAFGFDDDDDVDVSAIPYESIESFTLLSKGVLREKGNGKAKQKSICRNPVRLSTKEILKSLHFRRIREEVNDNKDVKVVNHEEDQHVKEHENTRKDENKHNMQEENLVTHFSDTFDLLVEEEKQKDEQLDEKESGPFPLFADLEPPTHFIDPPKCIYKRKRAVKFSFSEGSDDEENCNVEKERMKKKAKKVNKEDKRLNEWAININKTFEEIDNFHLVVE